MTIRAALRLPSRLVVLAAVALAALAPAAVSAENPSATRAVVPIHGTILAELPGGDAVVATDEVVGMLPASSRRYALIGTPALPVGTQIDALLERAASPWRLTAIHRAGREVAGTADPAAAQLLGVGDRMPDPPLVDQHGRIVRLDQLAGKVTLLSFIYTRCPRGDLCPLISAKYAALQRRLDPAHFRLAEVTLDPRFDSPAVMRFYGARYGADARGWSLLTGEPMQVKALEDRFGVTSLEDGPGHYNHDDQLVVIGRDGRIARIVPTGSWSPDEIVATARATAGDASDPVQRFVLDAFGSFVAFCGGSVSTGLAMLQAGAIIAGFVVFGTVLVLFGRRIWRRESGSPQTRPRSR